MKNFFKTKFFLGFLSGISVTLVAIFSWEMIMLSSTLFNCVRVNTPIENEELEGFPYYGKPTLPEGSSHHYFFRYGLGDVTEFWSFDLPPSQIKPFVIKCAKNRNLDCISSEKLPSKVTRPLTNRFKDCYKEWMPDYWFNNIEELDEMYYKDDGGMVYFVAYSKAKNRVYLMNWNY